MSQPIELAVDTYVRAWNERDRAVGQMMIDEFFAADGRLVTRIRVVSAIDARGTTFRFRAVADRRNGVSPENLEVGEVDVKGPISLILTFNGPLPEAASSGP